MKTLKLKLSAFFLLCSAFNTALLAQKRYDDPDNSIYQYAVPVETRMAYLWVPPKCRQIRGVIVALCNLLERNWLEDPVIRKTAAEEGLGIIWIGPVNKKAKQSPVFTADMKNGAGELLEKMLKNFADVSGYSEIEFAPIISMGHSANGQFAWEVPNWRAGRTIAAIPIKTMPLPQSLNFVGVPLCYIVGETTEWPQYRVPDPATKPGDRDFFWPVVRSSAVTLRMQDSHNLVSVVVDPGGGHFDWSPRLSEFVSLFIHKACKYRLPDNQPKNSPVKLKSIVPELGWLTDTGGMEPDAYGPAPYLSYKGDPKQAYWFFDKQTAIAAVALQGDRKPRKKQMLTFVQDERPLAVAKLGYAALKFEPEEDGVTFRVKGSFLNKTPPELIGSGRELGHAPGSIQFRVITGPAVQTGPDEFRIQFNRSDYGGAVWIQEEHPGDNEYRHAVQPGQMQIPAELLEGTQQKINFPAIANCEWDTVKAIHLNATADSKLPVQYYVVAGPAIVENGILKIKQVPVKSKYPISITVVAYQIGRVIPPLFQSATPVTQRFFLYK